jgi:hypothetical protein
MLEYMYVSKEFVRNFFACDVWKLTLEDAYLDCRETIFWRVTDLEQENIICVVMVHNPDSLLEGSYNTGT